VIVGLTVSAMILAVGANVLMWQIDRWTSRQEAVPVIAQTPEPPTPAVLAQPVSPAWSNPVFDRFQEIRPSSPRAFEEMDFPRYRPSEEHVTYGPTTYEYREDFVPGPGEPGTAYSVSEHGVK
jgi:hypothetical protein